MIDNKVYEPNKALLIILILISIFVLIVETLVENNIAISIIGLLFALIGTLFVIFFTNEERFIAILTFFTKYYFLCLL